MLSREDFVFTIGYDGPAAMIDSQAKKRYKTLSTKELAEKGFFRAAYSSAVYSKDPEELRLIALEYERFSGMKVEIASLGRLFGVFPVEASRTIFL
ncbi:MAG: hypothetical protein LBH43_09375 [Treponema sp.]|jgi:hypothetical protein|nr:hypothetical protein [Treponema sp.]